MKSIIICLFIFCSIPAFAHNYELSCKLNVEIDVYKKTFQKWKFDRSYTKFLTLPASIIVQSDYRDSFSNGWFESGYNVNDKTLDVKVKIKSDSKDPNTAMATIVARYSDENIKTEDFIVSQTVNLYEGWEVELTEKLPEPESTYKGFRSSVKKISLTCIP